MTLFEIVDILKKIALNQPNIRSVSDGSVYDALNNNPSVHYDVFHISQTTHQEDFETDYYGLQLFYISRLEDSLEDNRLQIQSIGKEILGNVIRTFSENFSIDYPTITYIPFTQRFNDLTAGVYCNVRLEVPKDLVCADDYTAETVPGSGLKLQDIGITITENGLRVITADAEYDGIGEIRIQTEVPQSAAVLQDKEVEYTENGSYTVHPDPAYDGLSSVSVDVLVPDNYDKGYDDGKEDGKQEQKSKMVATAFTENGEYTRADGYSAVTVNVEATSDRYDEGYADGENAQKAKLTVTSFTENNTYTRENGWSAVTVDVPSDYQDGYDDGVADQKAKMVATAITENGEYGRPDGYSAITVNVPQGQGYEEGYEDGETAQKDKLTATSFTQNDTYTIENGWSSVTVNVDDRYDEGYADGFAAGASACSGLFISAITLNVDSAITDSATATTTFSPLTAITDIYYTSSDPSIAPIDSGTGVITALGIGNVTICTNDRWSGLQDCKTVVISNFVIPYTADTSTIAATGETRCVTLDTTGLNTSTIGLTYTGATGVTYVINGNQVCITFPNNTGLVRDFNVKITASTINGGPAYADLTFHQASVDYQNTWLKITYLGNSGAISNGKGSYDMVTDGTKLVTGNVTAWTGYPANRTLYFHLTGNSINSEEFYNPHNPEIYDRTYNTISSVVVPSGVTSIGDRAFVGHYYSDVHSRYYGMSAITLPNTVTSFGESSFASNTVLQSITLPTGGPTGIPSYCFASTSVYIGPGAGAAFVLPSNVQVIEAGAFKNVRIPSITFPAGLVEIKGENCNCCGVFPNSHINTLIFNGTTPPTIACGGFGLVNTDYTIQVPSSAVNTYKAAWPDYADKIIAKS